MRSKAVRGIFARAAFAAAAAGATVTLGACAASSYAGISLRPGAADPGVQDLARRAKLGDRHAQLELGARYEQGLGVSRDLRRAEYLYSEAGKDRGGTRQVYVPKGPHSPAMWTHISLGPLSPGLPEAKRRLAELRLRLGLSR